MSHTRQPTRIGSCSMARSGLPQLGERRSRFRKMHWVHQPRLERLELRALLSGTTFGDEQVIEELDQLPQAIFAADLDGEGDLDVLLASLGASTSRDSCGSSNVHVPLAWYENVDGAGTWGAKRVISREDCKAQSVSAADLDGDGDLDVLAIFDSRPLRTLAWYENTDGRGNFGPRQEVAPSFNVGSVSATDLDGDGDLDVLAVVEDPSSWPETITIVWYDNTDGAGSFGPQSVIARDAGDPRAVSTVDLDGDHDLDLLLAIGSQIVWFENDGAVGFRKRDSITANGGSIRSVVAADLDGDGDQDVLATEQDRSRSGAPYAGHKVAWYENRNGAGSFGPQRPLITTPGIPTDVIAADLDGDLDQDVLWATTGQIAWWENVDGRGKLGPKRVISQSTMGVTSLFAADLDGDGDQDLLLATGRYGQRRVAWYENTDGRGNFGPQRVIRPGAGSTYLVLAADLDGDGDQDVISATGFTIVWYENTDGRGTFGQSRLVFEAFGVASVSTADLDEDGDQDVLATHRVASVGGVVSFYENGGGQGPLGEFGPGQVIATSSGDSPTGVRAADMDGDGDLDVISIFDSKIAWYENLLPHPGDANRDGQFDSRDLVQVFQRGEYEDGIVGNSSWEEGDWNGDGEFDSGDLVLAFQKGLYENKLRVVESKIAAAVDALFAMEEKLAGSATFVA